MPSGRLGTFPGGMRFFRKGLSHRHVLEGAATAPFVPDHARFAASGAGIPPVCCRQVEAVAVPQRRPPVGPIPGAHFRAKLIDALEFSIVGHLEFHRCWLLSTFTRDRQWDNEGKFVYLMNHAVDEFSRRELILALGRACHSHWFKTRKRAILSLPPWERRAFIAAASCLPGDEHKHWTRSIEGRLDPLEVAVAAWARQNKFV